MWGTGAALGGQAEGRKSLVQGKEPHPAPPPNHSPGFRNCSHTGGLGGPTTDARPKPCSSSFPPGSYLQGWPPGRAGRALMEPPATAARYPNPGLLEAAPRAPHSGPEPQEQPPCACSPPGHRTPALPGPPGWVCDWTDFASPNKPHPSVSSCRLPPPRLGGLLLPVTLATSSRKAAGPSPVWPRLAQHPRPAPSLPRHQVDSQTHSHTRSGPGSNPGPRPVCLSSGR